MLPQVESTLRAIIAFDPKKQRLGADLKVLPNTWWRFLYLDFGQTTNGDLQSCRRALVDILIKHIRSNNEAAVHLFNLAVHKFNHHVPEYALDQFCSAKLRHLQKEYIHPIADSFPGDLLTVRNYCTLEMVENYGRSFGYSHWSSHFPKIAQFESYGGRVILLEHLERDRRYGAKFAVSDQQFACVCHAGLMRSPTMKLILTLIKNKLGFHHGRENLRPTHGVCGGYDPYGDEKPPQDDIESYCLWEFMAAFDRHRGERFGKNLSKEEFIDRYYRHEDHLENKSKVFITFADVGFTLIDRFLKANPNTTFNKVTVVMIPDGDFISNCYIQSTHYFLFTRLISKETQKPPYERRELSDLSDEERRNVYWTVTGIRKADAKFEEHLSHYVSEIDLDEDLDDQLHSLMITEGYRTAFWRWSGLFIPIQIRDG